MTAPQADAGRTKQSGCPAIPDDRQSYATDHCDEGDGLKGRVGRAARCGSRAARVASSREESGREAARFRGPRCGRGPNADLFLLFVRQDFPWKRCLFVCLFGCGSQLLTSSRLLSYSAGGPARADRGRSRSSATGSVLSGGPRHGGRRASWRGPPRQLSHLEPPRRPPRQLAGLRSGLLSSVFCLLSVTVPPEGASKNVFLTQSWLQRGSEKRVTWKKSAPKKDPSSHSPCSLLPAPRGPPPSRRVARRLEPRWLAVRRVSIVVL